MVGGGKALPPAPSPPRPAVSPKSTACSVQPCDPDESRVGGITPVDPFARSIANLQGSSDNPTGHHVVGLAARNLATAANTVVGPGAYGN